MVFYAAIASGSSWTFEVISSDNGKIFSILLNVEYYPIIRQSLQDYYFIYITLFFSDPVQDPRSLVI